MRHAIVNFVGQSVLTDRPSGIASASLDASPFNVSRDGRINVVRTHEAIDRRSLEPMRRIVAKIDADPNREGLAHARNVCARRVERGNLPAREWMAILQRPWEEIRTILLDESDEGSGCVDRQEA